MAIVDKYQPVSLPFVITGGLSREELIFGLNRNFKTIEELLSLVILYENKTGRPVNRAVENNSGVFAENVRGYFIKYGEKAVFMQEEEPPIGSGEGEAQEFDLWLRYENGDPVWRQLRRTAEGTYVWVVVANRGDRPAEYDIITTLGLDAAVITAGVFHGARIYLGAESSFQSGYDPSEKETPEGAQDKADTAEAEAKAHAEAEAEAALNAAKAHADKIANGEASGTFIDGKMVISPIIAGAEGYFSNKVTVGQGGHIVLDGVAKEIQLLDGAKLVGQHGVISVFQFVSAGSGTYGPTQGWGDFGIIGAGGEYSRGKVGLRVYVPSNFVITKAAITLEAMPVYYEDHMLEVYKWKQSRNLRLYTAVHNEGFYWYIEHSGSSNVWWRDGVNRTSAVLGVTSWSPTLAYSGPDPANTENKIQYRSGSIAGYLTPGQTTVFYVETTDTPNPTNFENNQGLGKLVAVVEGFAKSS